MKSSLILVLILFVSSVLNAQTTLGVQDSVYVGTGLLKSKSIFIPNIGYSSTRVVKNGVITARTKAALHGLKVGEAQAKLKVQMLSATKFNMLDISNNLAVCGTGTCNENSCTFTATVMSGSLQLTETWVPTDEGFNVVNGRQVFYGVESFYSGQFTVYQ